MKVPPVRLQGELPDEVLEEVSSVLRSGFWIDGKNVEALEREFAEYCGVKHCRAVSSGTAALLCALAAVGLEPGDEVIVPSFSFVATANAVRWFKAKPVFVDVDEDTFNLDPDAAEAAVTPKTKAIVPVHLYGLPVDADRVNEVASERGLVVVEDACQAHGAEYRGKKTGSLGDLAAFSLYPTKNVVCGGEGGLVTTNDDELGQRVRLFSNHGQTAKYVHEVEGYNFRMAEVNAVVARYSLGRLDANNGTRRRHAAVYDERLGKLPGLVLPTVPEGRTHVYHQYTVRTSRREELKAALSAAGVGFGVHYQTPIHAQPLYSKLAHATLPVTERLAGEVISLPVHHNLSKEEVEAVCDVVTGWGTGQV
ncbi:MAG: DegT/DnrJ/EryC1/StrS family aminotransferase [Promethearchaeota archaeon]